ncbi:hypothetical protein V6N11_039164 [Hibiscus sabdariffa]|uniref:Uncharacterized protein n=1 Tax=Hibiscus sabdariffa TaxID=183260 RepID=A0ABR2SM73_9ROSI
MLPCSEINDGVMTLGEELGTSDVKLQKGKWEVKEAGIKKQKDKKTRNLHEIDVSEILAGASVKEKVMASIMNVNNFVMSLALCGYWETYKIMSSTYSLTNVLLLSSSLFDPWGQGSFKGGRKVVLDEYGSPKVVNDEVTTARAIELPNAMENVGDSLEEKNKKGS